MTQDHVPFCKVIGMSRSEVPDCVTTSDCSRGSGYDGGSKFRALVDDGADENNGLVSSLLL